MAIGVIALVGISMLSACGSDGGKDEPAASSAEEKAALAKYQDFLDENAKELINWTTQLRGQIVADRLSKAGSRYATARAQYAQIEVAAQTLQVDGRINARTGKASSELGGFHYIEWGIFADGGTRPIVKSADALLKEVETVPAGLQSVADDPEAIATDASDLMEEVSGFKLSGYEELYAHIDLVDISGNIEGVQAAYEALKPLLIDGGGHALAKELETSFTKTFEALEEYGFPASVQQIRPAAAGASFTPFDQLPPAFLDELRGPIQRLNSQIAQLPRHIAVAG